MYTHICIRTWTYIYSFIHCYAYIGTHGYNDTCINVTNLHPYLYIHPSIHTYNRICTYIHTYITTYVYICMWCVLYVCMHIFYRMHE